MTVDLIPMKTKQTDPVLTDDVAFRRAVCTTPDCDTTRLGYADYLEEVGRSDHAEFIRVQVRSESESPCRTCSTWSRRGCREPGCKFGSDDRAATLLTVIDRPMPVPHFVGGGGPGETRTGYFWWRGFVWSAVMTAEEWGVAGPHRPGGVASGVDGPVPAVRVSRRVDVHQRHRDAEVPGVPWCRPDSAGVLSDLAPDHSHPADDAPTAGVSG